MASSTGNYEIFKNALLYSVTFRIVNALDHHSEGDVVALTASAFMGTCMVQGLRPQMTTMARHNNTLVTPIAKLSLFLIDTLTSAGIHMQSNLLAKYAATLYDDDETPLYVFVNSLLGLLLIWTLGVSIGAL